MVLGHGARREDEVVRQWFCLKLVATGHWLRCFSMRDGGGDGKWAMEGRVRWSIKG